MENPLVDEMVATPTTRHLSAQQILTRAVEIREEHIWRTLKGAGAKERDGYMSVEGACALKEYQRTIDIYDFQCTYTVYSVNTSRAPLNA